MPCLIDRVSIFVTGAYSNVSSPTTSRHSHQIPVWAGLVPALAPSPTDGRHRTARPGACTASRPKTVNSASHRWRRFPARLFPPQIWDAPTTEVELTTTEFAFSLVSDCTQACARIVRRTWIAPTCSHPPGALHFQLVTQLYPETSDVCLTLKESLRSLPHFLQPAPASAGSSHSRSPAALPPYAPSPRPRPGPHRSPRSRSDIP